MSKFSIDMMKKILIIPLVLFTFLFYGISVKARDFSGVITFQKIDGPDTVLYKYYVKGSKIRVESFDEQNELNGIMLINMETSSVIALSGTKKFYVNVPVSNKKQVNLDLEIVKTKNNKSIVGKKSNLWSVTDHLSGEKFEYWVNKDNYPFFNKMLIVLNREEPIAHVWIEMEVKDDYFPLIGVEYSASGEIVTKIETLEIEEKDLPETLFVLPADYELIERQ